MRGRLLRVLLVLRLHLHDLVEGLGRGWHRLLAAREGLEVRVAFLLEAGLLLLLRRVLVVLSLLHASVESAGGRGVLAPAILLAALLDTEDAVRLRPGVLVRRSQRRRLLLVPR